MLEDEQAVRNGNENISLNIGVNFDGPSRARLRAPSRSVLKEN